MKVSLLGQGLDSKQQVGKVLLESIRSGIFSSFSCFVAFVSHSGITGILDALSNSNHFSDIKFFVGIDQGITSQEALLKLQESGIETYVYHTTSSDIFHPKIYVLSGEKRSKIILGSSNLTVPGLFQNVEASVVIDFERGDEEGEHLMTQLMTYFKSVNLSNPNVHKLSPEIIKQLTEYELLESENRRKQTRRWETKRTRERKDEITRMFPGVSLGKAPKNFRVKGKSFNNLFETSEEFSDYERKLLWKKPELPASDVLFETKGTHATGGLRLTQARWKVKGDIIDQTTYFRRQVFGSFGWRVEKVNPFVEISEVPCEIIIFGKHKGNHLLTVRHKPSGEAGQGNYTTIISWSGVGDIIRAQDLRGADFYIYEVSENSRKHCIFEFKERHGAQ